MEAGNGNPLQYSCLENSMVRGVSRATVHGVTKSQHYSWVEIHTAKSFSVVSEAEVDVFLEFSCFFYDLVDVGNLISGVSAFSKSSLNIWKFSVHVLLKPGLENFERYFASI